MPLHADIQVLHIERVGLDCLTPILWYKIANGVSESEGNGGAITASPTSRAR